METPMYCYQCEQTNRGTGCVLFGVCGKDAVVAGLQDLLVYQLQGISHYAAQILDKGGKVSPETSWFVIDSLFATLTNVNFDRKDFLVFLKQSQRVKESVCIQAGARLMGAPAAATYCLPEDEEAILAEAAKPVLAFCRSGTRSIVTWSLGQAASGARTRDELVQLGRNARYDLSGVLGG